MNSEDLLRTHINAVFDREIARVEKIICDIAGQNKVSLYLVVEEYKEIRRELLGDKEGGNTAIEYIYKPMSKEALEKVTQFKPRYMQHTTEKEG